MMDPAFWVEDTGVWELSIQPVDKGKKCRKAKATSNFTVGSYLNHSAWAEKFSNSESKQDNSYLNLPEHISYSVSGLKYWEAERKTSGYGDLAWGLRSLFVLSEEELQFLARFTHPPGIFRLSCVFQIPGRLKGRANSQGWLESGSSGSCNISVETGLIPDRWTQLVFPWSSTAVRALSKTWWGLFHLGVAVARWLSFPGLWKRVSHSLHTRVTGTVTWRGLYSVAIFLCSPLDLA